MFRRTRASLAWVKMLRQFRRGDFVGAAQAAVRYRDTGLTNPTFEALDATVDILNFRSQEAKTKFEYVLRWLKDSSRSEDKYICAYSLYFLSLIDKKDDADELRLTGLSLATPR